VKKSIEELVKELETEDSVMMGGRADRGVKGGGLDEGLREDYSSVMGSLKVCNKLTDSLILQRNSFYATLDASLKCPCSGMVVA